MLTKSTNRNHGLNIRSLTLLLKTMILTKLHYASPLWLGGHLELFRGFWNKVIMKISGAMLNPNRQLTELVLHLPPLDIQLEIYTVKFLCKVLGSKDFVTSTLIQIEGSLQNEFYPQLAAIKGFLAWKEEGNIRTREVQLTEQKHQQLVQYHKTEIEVYQQKIWTDRIQNRIQIRPKSLEMDETLMNIIRRMHKKEILLNKHNYLFNYSTTKMEDSLIMDYIHGNSLLFGTVSRKLDEREDGKCYFCNTLAVDDPAHQMLECEEVKDVTYNDLKQHYI